LGELGLRAPTDRGFLSKVL